MLAAESLAHRGRLDVPPKSGSSKETSATNPSKWVFKGTPLPSNKHNASPNLPIFTFRQVQGLTDLSA